MMRGHYILKGHEPVECDLPTWGKFFGNIDNRRVDNTELTVNGEGVRVSTVFLGIDHSFGDGGPPLLFETMIFGGDHDEYCERHSTWEEAEAGHAKACRIAKGEESEV